MDKFFEWTAYLSMFVLFVTPVTHNLWKFVLLPIVLIGILGRAVRQGGFTGIHPTILNWTLYYVALGVGFAFYGLLQDAPGGWFLMAIYGAFPLVYILFVGGAKSLSIIRKLESTMVIGGTAFSIYVMYFVLWALGWVPHSMFFKLDEAQGVGLYDGWVHLRLYAISGLVFFVPFSLAALTLFSDRDLPLISRRWLWVAVATGCVATVLSGRKALVLVVAVAPVFILIFRRFLPYSEQRATSRRVAWVVFVGALMLLAGGVYLQQKVGFDFGRVLDVVESGFRFSSDIGANERSKQFSVLIQEWLERPLFGWGWGQGARAMARSERPWEYELQYLLLLFSTGMVGFVAYCAGIVWTFLTGLRIIKGGGEYARHMLPLLVGLTSILVANGTNPYLPAFGNLWMLFLPIALVNTWYLSKAPSRSISMNLASPAFRSAEPESI